MTPRRIFIMTGLITGLFVFAFTTISFSAGSKTKSPQSSAPKTEAAPSPAATSPTPVKKKTPTPVVKKGWCCAEGAVLKGKITPSACEEKGGAFFTSSAQAKKNCGFCCKEGAVTTVADSKAKSACTKDGTFYTSESSAKANCGWCCRGETVFSVTSIKQCSQKGDSFQTTQSTAEKVCQPLKGFCNVGKRMLTQVTKQKCKNLKGLFFTSRSQANANLFKNRKKSGVAKSAGQPASSLKKAKASAAPESTFVKKDKIGVTKSAIQPITSPKKTAKIDPAPPSSMKNPKPVQPAYVSISLQPKKESNIYPTSDAITVMFKVKYAAQASISTDFIATSIEKGGDVPIEPTDRGALLRITHPADGPIALRDGGASWQYDYPAGSLTPGKYTWTVIAHGTDGALTRKVESLRVEQLTAINPELFAEISKLEIPSGACAPDNQVWELFRLINEERARRNLGELTWHDGDAEHACLWSRRMCDENFCGHEAQDGTRDTSGLNYNRLYSSNIYCGSGSAQRAFERWMESPPHQGNMLAASGIKVGIGRGCNGWTALFSNR